MAKSGRPAVSIARKHWAMEVFWKHGFEYVATVAGPAIRALEDGNAALKAESHGPGHRDLRWCKQGGTRIFAWTNRQTPEVIRPRPERAMAGGELAPDVDRRVQPIAAVKFERERALQLQCPAWRGVTGP
jgi:hypothetical protein